MALVPGALEGRALAAVELSAEAPQAAPPAWCVLEFPCLWISSVRPFFLGLLATTLLVGALCGVGLSFLFRGPRARGAQGAASGSGAASPGGAAPRLRFQTPAERRNIKAQIHNRRRGRLALPEIPNFPVPVAGSPPRDL